MEEKWMCGMTRGLRLLLLVGVIAMAGGQALGSIYSPWVLSDRVADTRDEARFAADARWAGLEGQEKALAVWRYLVDRETGSWHFSDMWEGSDPYWESKLVKDPTKILNVYGFGVCTMHACLIEGLYEALGFGVRQQEFGGYHRTAEVEWEGRWHYLDVDERAYLVDQEGCVVSVTDATTRPELWERSAEVVSPFYPQNGGIKGIEELSKHGPPVAHWHWRTSGHSMDFSLRPGESLTRYFEGQGRWRMCEAWQEEGTRRILEEAPAGPKTSSSISVNNSYGNGRWWYAPKLSSRYTDFEEGVYRKQNITLDEKGVTPAAPGKGSVEWRVRTPYVIAGDPKDLGDPNDDAGAAVVEFTVDGTGELSVSTDQGRTWQRVWSVPNPRGRQTVDLTPWVQGRYEYHIRFDLTGEPGVTRLRQLRLTTWVQVAPMSLPRLKSGVNRLEFVWGDRHGLATEVMAVEPELSDAADAARWGVKVDGEYVPDDRLMRARGPVTLPVKALEGTRIRWLHIGGAFNATRPEAGGKPDRILYSLEPGGEWHVLREETPPEWDRHWYYNMESEVMLDRPADQVWVRLDPATAVNGIRVYAHCEPTGAGQDGSVQITHAYRTNGQLRRQTFHFYQPRAYQIGCRLEPENVYVKLAVPSRRKRD